MTDLGGEIEAGGDDSPRDFEAEARVQGWKGLDEFTGDPAKHKSAEQFVKDGEANLSLSNARVKHLTSSLEAEKRRGNRLEKDFAKVQEMMTGMEKRAYDRAYADLSEKRDSAIEAGDVAGVRALDTKIESLREESTPAKPDKPATKYEPQTIQRLYADFLAENEWFDEGATGGGKKAATLYAGTVADELGMIDDFDGTPAEYFKAIGEKVREKYGERYPQLFGGKEDDEDGEEGEKPRRKSAVEGVSGTRGRNAPKGVSGLTAEQRAQAQRFVDMGVFPNIEAAAKEYHANA